jgi:hypothetical protein
MCVRAFEQGQLNHWLNSFFDFSIAKQELIAENAVHFFFQPCSHFHPNPKGYLDSTMVGSISVPIPVVVIFLVAIIFSHMYTISPSLNVLKDIASSTIGDTQAISTTTSTAAVVVHPTSTVGYGPKKGREKYKMAFKESYGFFDDVSTTDWEIARSITMNRVNNERSEDPLFQRENPPAWYQSE